MSHTAPAGAFHIPSLDGIRAFSFLVVFVAHAGLHHVVPGGFGVTVFFFLSGFLITTLMRMEVDSTGALSFRNFYLRRVLRILPPFYLVLGAAVLANRVGLLDGSLDVRAVLAQVFHFANYWIIRHDYTGQPLGTGVYWSLAVEEHFYLVFPLVYWTLRRLGLSSRGQAWVLVGLCAAVLVWRCVLVYGFGVHENRTYLASDTRVDSILFGCLLAVHANPVLDAKTGEPFGFSERVWKGLLFPAGVLLLLLTFLYRDAQFRESVRYTLQGVALYPIFVVAMRFPGWGPMRVLNMRWVSFLGVLSYSLYLVHHVVIYVLHLRTPGLHPALQGVLALAISIALSYGLYVAIEKPCARLRKKLTTTRSPPERVSVPAASA